MIRYSEINDKRKNHPDLRAKIIALIEKHSRSPNDLYEACRREAYLTHSEFRQFLDDMHCDGDIYINANNRVVLPKPPPEIKPSAAAKKEAHTSQPPEVTDAVENRPNEILIHCLVNPSRALKHPKQKKYLDDGYYAHRNYKIKRIPLASVCEETLLKGYQFVPGEFHELEKRTQKVDDDDIIVKKKRVSDGKIVSESKMRDKKSEMKVGQTIIERIIRDSHAWMGQQLFLIEFDLTTEATLLEFIDVRPFVREYAWLVTESIRSGYDDPDDPTCNGQRRPRLVFCMPDAVKTQQERDWVYTALVRELPGCDTGSANSITNGGLGNASADFVKIGKIVDTDWFNAAIAAGKKVEQEKQAKIQRDKQAYERKRAERAAMGFTEREGELPLEALGKSDPSLFLESLGLSLKSESGKYQHWGRPEKRGDTALSVWQSDSGNYQIRVFANSITTPPGVSGAMPFTRFYCYHELHTDIEGLQPDSQEWKSINAQLAYRGYGTWLSDDDFRQKHAPPVSGSRDVSDLSGLDPVAPLPPDHPLIANAPPVSEVRESPSFRYFSDEERKVVQEVLGISPDAGWHGSTPIWTPTYASLHRLTNQFALNGQPREVEKRRVYCTLYGKCDVCGATTAPWIDRYLLTAGDYCDGCHKDYPRGSYLEIELNRKLPNSIISEHQGFLGNNPDFSDFRLFQPGMLTHLGSGMGTGKTTESAKALVALALQGLGKGIIVVPRIALALQLAYKLRAMHGYRAWGLWTEGVSKDNKFIGDSGAIVCLPSLPQAVGAAEAMGAERLNIVVDELDFGYELLSLTVNQAASVKKILREALKSTGLVVAGQTESTLALEAFAQEIEAEQVQGFYNIAAPAEGYVELKEHPAETNNNALLASGIDDIDARLRSGQHVYAFPSTRRDGAIIAEAFSAENPLFYNAYTRGEHRSHELLRHQKLTDTKLFIGTSAAGVGISFLDTNAVTVVMGGLLFGSRNANMMTQMAIRDRGRRSIVIHHKPYNFPLPVRPTENRDVSLYHEALKQADVPTHAITKIAAAQALAQLADALLETSFAYHLGTVGNMAVVQSAPAAQPKDVAEAIGIRRAEIRKIENEVKKENATAILKTVFNDEPHTQLLTSSEIRKKRNQGRLSTDSALANELANEAARAVGWDDEVDWDQVGDPFRGLFTEADIDIALALVERNFDFDAVIKKRNGYLAVNAPKWTANRFDLEVSSADTQLVFEGLGVEITAVKDYRFIGELLKTLIDQLTGQIFEAENLAAAVKSVLKTPAKSGKTFGQEILSGALGTSEYRKARFLHSAEDDNIIVNWVARFISEWYPARLAKKENYYALQPDTHAQLYLKAFERWLQHQPDVFDSTQIQLDIFEPIEMPEANAELKQIARQRRAKGETLKAIAKDLGIEHQTVSRWCKDITPKKQHKETRQSRQKERQTKKQMNAKKKQEQINEAYRLFTKEDMSYREIAKRLGVKSPMTIANWLKTFPF